MDAMPLLQENLEFDLAIEPVGKARRKDPLAEQLLSFRDFGKATRCFETKAQSFSGADLRAPAYVNEFWTARQRAANNLHEISYRACFKPQLPRFFIERLTAPGDVVYDPFMGRGTTVIEAALLGRAPAGCDVNPLSTILAAPRLSPPTFNEVAARLDELNLTAAFSYPQELEVFYHPETLREICALREHVLARERRGTLDNVDR